MKVLVTGGAGYIGSHTVKLLIDAGHKVIILDNFSNCPEVKIFPVPYIKADITDLNILQQTLQNIEFDAVMNFAGKIEVAESIENPEIYYHTNVTGLLNILRIMMQKNARTIIQSSTAAVYGNPQTSPISEDFLLDPINPYGRSKRMAEDIIIDFSNSFKISSVIFRYFNAAGASTDNTIGANHKHVTHVIPLLLDAVENGKEFNLFGDDYPTPDGTPIRDYVHVLDIADAHVKALETYHNKNQCEILNIGTGQGYSVRELISVVEKITGKSVNVVQKPRREGDPASLVASNQKIQNKLAWKAKYSDLRTIINTAHYWYKKQRNN